MNRSEDYFLYFLDNNTFFFFSEADIIRFQFSGNGEGKKVDIPI